jgi:hypothetical protein
MSAMNVLGAIRRCRRSPIAITRKDGHGDVFREWVGSQLTRRYPSIEDGHREVHEDHVWLNLTCTFNRVSPVLRHRDPKALKREVLGQQVSSVLIIVDDQNRWLLWHRYHASSDVVRSPVVRRVDERARSTRPDLPLPL